MAPFTLGIIGFISDKYTCQIHSIGYPSSFIISLRTLTFAVEAKEDIGVMKKWDIGHGRRRKCAQVGQRACPCWATCLPHLGNVVIRNFAPPKFRKVKPPTKNTINKECKCGKNREAFINFAVETKK